MRETQLTLPEIGVIAATRGLLGAGVAFLLADRIPANQRKTVGWTLVSIGAISTIPLALTVFGRSRCSEHAESPDQSAHHPRVDSDQQFEPQSLAAGV